MEIIESRESHHIILYSTNSGSCTKFFFSLFFSSPHEHFFLTNNWLVRRVARTISEYATRAAVSSLHFDFDKTKRDAFTTHAENIPRKCQFRPSWNGCTLFLCLCVRWQAVLITQKIKYFHLHSDLRLCLIGFHSSRKRI